MHVVPIIWSIVISCLLTITFIFFNSLIYKIILLNYTIKGKSVSRTRTLKEHVIKHKIYENKLALLKKVVGGHGLQWEGFADHSDNICNCGSRNYGGQPWLPQQVWRCRNSIPNNLD
jgi:hypothetical protein